MTVRGQLRKFTAVKLTMVQIGFLLLTLLCSEIALAGDFLIAPYLRKVTSTSVTIVWELTEPQECYFFYGSSGEELKEQPIKLLKDSYHLIDIQDLQPGTLYYYYVGFNKNAAPEIDSAQFFKTSGAGRVPFTFAVLGDTSSGRNGFDMEHKRVINSVMTYTYPEFLILSGDLVMDGRRKDDWVSFFEVEREILRNTPIYASRGNNEEYGKKYFHQYFHKKEDPLWYSFDYAGCHFIALDILKGQGQRYYDSFRPGDEQFSWLLKDLQSAANINAAFTFVFFHAPVFPPHGDTSQVLEELLHPVFSKYGVDMVFNGTHTFSRAEKDGVVYYISGGGGAELFKNPIIDRPEIKETFYLLHHLRVAINYPVITIEAIDTNGNIFSSYRYWDPEADQQDKGESAISLKDIKLSREEAEDLLQSEAGQEKINVTVFSLPNCSYCDTLLEKTLPELGKKTGLGLKIAYLPLDEVNNFEKMVYIEESLNQRNNELPAVLIGRKMIGGERAIKANLEKTLLAFAGGGQEGLENVELSAGAGVNIDVTIRERFASFKALPVFTAGLIDGINPCAFTVIIFLLSYLIYVGKNKRQILLAGLFFTLGVLFTYMLIGFGLSSILSSISVYGYISDAIKYLTLLIVFVLGIYNLYDYYLCCKGRQQEIKLQLPEFFKKKIHEQIRSKARSSRLMVASLVLGFFVSTFELACTGQIYIPTIIYMLEISTEKFKAFTYLILYNLAFILPLAVVFIAFYFGMSEQTVKTLMQKNVKAVKLAMAILFFGLGIAILFT